MIIAAAVKERDRRFIRVERERERERAVKTAGIQIKETKLCTRNAIHTIVHEIE